VQAYAGNTLPNGWLLCDGSAVSRTDYADLYAVIGDTYGNGDGSTTFNVPNLVDKFVEGSATAGTEKSAGLPNIKGSFTNRSDTTNSGMVIGASGAISRSMLSSTSAVQVQFTSTTARSNQEISFNAANSNSIYSDSVTTVQPPALTMRYIIKY
jgi:microcystin-dependent protein